MLKEKVLYLCRDTMQLIILSESKLVVPLELRDFNLLQNLVNAEGLSSTRQELLESGWPGRIVSETSLNVAIMKLRKGLSDFSDILEIKTVSGSGYRLKLSDDVSLVLSESEFQERLNLFTEKVENEDVSVIEKSASISDEHSKSKRFLNKKVIFLYASTFIVYSFIYHFLFD